MKLFHRKKKDINLSGMESRIEATLRPVTPRRAFVDDLRSRLMAYSPQPAPVTIINREKEVQRGWLIAGGVVGSLLMLIISIRGLLSIAGIIGLLVRYFNYRKRTPFAQPA